MEGRSKVKTRPLLELLELAEQREQWNREAGKRLRRARIDAGLSQGELGKAIEASQADVSQVEHGKGLSAEQQRLFAGALEEAAKGEEQHEPRKRQRKRGRSS